MIRFLITLLIFNTFTFIQQAHAEERTLKHDGRERSYIIDKPTNVPSDAKLPVVFVLHGGGGNGENAKEMTHFTEKVMPKGVIIVYPSGTGRFERMAKLKTWNANHCCAHGMKNNVDDVGFISKLIDTVIAHDNADPKRVYVTGMSNGGMMSNILGTELSHKITAIAPVVGGMFGDEHMPSNAVSAIIINGKLDESVPLSGGLGGGRFSNTWDGTPVKPSSYQSDFWAKANNCSPDPDVSQYNGDSMTIYRHACPEGREVVRYVVNDMGHAWPGGERGSSLGDDPNTALDATAAIWDFFARQSK